MNQHQILSQCTKFELNWLINKKVTKNLIFDGTKGKIREPKSEKKAWTDNAYDITNFFDWLENFLTYTAFLSIFIVVRH